MKYNGDVWREDKVVKQFVSNMTAEIMLPVTHYFYKTGNRVLRITEVKYGQLLRAKRSVEMATCR